MKRFYWLTVFAGLSCHVPEDDVPSARDASRDVKELPGKEAGVGDAALDSAGAVRRDGSPLDARGDSPKSCAEHPLVTPLACAQSIDCACAECGATLESCQEDAACSQMLECATTFRCDTEPDCYRNCRVLTSGSEALALYDDFVGCFANDTCEKRCPCDLGTCPTASLYPLATLSPCCPPDAVAGACGLELGVAQSYYGARKVEGCWAVSEAPTESGCPNSKSICFPFGRGASEICTEMAGCCLPDGQCGYVLSFVGEAAPCVARQAFGDDAVACP